jgi:hypothetical protein
VGITKLQITALVAICLVATGLSSPAQASFVDSEGDLASQRSGDDRIGNYREIPALWSSFLWPNKTGLNCWNSTDSRCRLDSSVSGHGFIVAPTCGEVKQNFCVQEFYAVDSNGKKYVASTTRAVNQESNPSFSVRTRNSTLKSGNPSLWRFPSAYADQREYLVNAFTMVLWGDGESRVNLVGLELAVTPVLADPEGISIVEKNLPEGFRYGVKLRLDWEVGGYLMGRIASSSIRQRTIKAGVSRLVTIEAAPEEVPKISGRNQLGGLAYSMQDYRRFAAQSKVIGDKATHVDRVFRAYSRKTVDYSCAGANSGFYGTGTTNAAMYAVDPPSYRNGLLNYEVASIHFLPDGETLNRGKYEMSLRSDVARCIYGLSKAPVSASIRVSNSNGDKVVATTVVSEKKGWLRLAAYGFTYSKKKITIRLNNKR